DRVEGKRARAGFALGVVVVFSSFKSGLEIVSAAYDREIVADDRAAVVTSTGIGRSQSSACSDAAALVRCAAERKGRERRWGDVLKSDLFGPPLVHINALVQIAKPVVADRKVVQDGRCNAPIFGDPRQPAGGVLKLVNVGRRTRRITPTSAGRVVPLAER